MPPHERPVFFLQAEKEVAPGHIAIVTYRLRSNVRAGRVWQNRKAIAMLSFIPVRPSAHITSVSVIQAVVNTTVSPQQPPII